MYYYCCCYHYYHYYYYYIESYAQNIFADVQTFHEKKTKDAVKAVNVYSDVTFFLKNNLLTF